MLCHTETRCLRICLRAIKLEQFSVQRPLSTTQHLVGRSSLTEAALPEPNARPTRTRVSHTYSGTQYCTVRDAQAQPAQAARAVARLWGATRNMRRRRRQMVMVDSVQGGSMESEVVHHLVAPPVVVRRSRTRASPRTYSALGARSAGRAHAKDCRLAPPRRESPTIPLPAQCAPRPAAVDAATGGGDRQPWLQCRQDHGQQRALLGRHVRVAPGAVRRAAYYAARRRAAAAPRRI